MTKRDYLALSVMVLTGCDVFLAHDAVSTIAIEHPDWDMDEVRTYSEWHKVMK